MEEENKPQKVRVDRDTCQTAATCLAFRIYELDDESKAVILTKNGQNSDDQNNPEIDADGYIDVTNLFNPDGKSDDELREMILESAKLCPFNAIIVIDKDGNQIWPLL